MSTAFESPYSPVPVEEWARGKSVTTLPSLLRNAIARFNVADEPFLGAKVNGTYRYETYAQVQQKIHQVASALIGLGLEPQDRVALWSGNCPEWPQVDFGVAHAALVLVPLYPTLSPQAVEALLTDSGSRLIVCSTAAMLEALLSIDAALPALENIVCFAGVASEGGSPARSPGGKKLWSWPAFLEYGREERKEEMERRIAALKATDVSSIVYTSGTTGEPKGAMLMHGNLVSNAFDCNVETRLSKGDLELSFLPLCHVFERIAQLTFTSVGGTIAYAESVDKVPANLAEVRPTSMPSVPRLYEKIHARMVEGLSKAPPVKQKLFAWALGAGKRYQEARARGRVPGWVQLQYEMAHRLVLKAVLARFGGRVRFFISGGAPLRKDLAEFFSYIGLTILEGYGLTETSPTITSNPPRAPRAGTVGKPIANTDVRIAPDGEVIVRGPQVMLGYFNKVDATREAIDADGFFHTGDIGEFTDEGYLKITDRKKDLLVMSNGKKVAPQSLEQRLNASPLIEQAVVLGDDRKYIAALIYPAYPLLQAFIAQSGVKEPYAQDSRLLEYLQKEVDRCCEGLSHYEVVKRIAILPRELSMEGGELTPTLKVKRKVITQKYAEQIASLYD